MRLHHREKMFKKEKKNQQDKNANEVSNSTNVCEWNSGLNWLCFASDGNGIQIVIANLVPEPIKRKVPWPREDDDDTSKLLRR